MYTLHMMIAINVETTRRDTWGILKARINNTKKQELLCQIVIRAVLNAISTDCSCCRHDTQVPCVERIAWSRASSNLRTISECCAVHQLLRRSSTSAPRHRQLLKARSDSCSRDLPATLTVTQYQTMRWPGSGTDDDKKKGPAEPWRATLTDPRSVILSIAAAATSVVAVRMYKTYLRRIPSVNHIKPDYFRRKGLFGQVTSVGDADNFRLYHTPGGRIAGWGWLPWKAIPTKRGLTNQTVSFALSTDSHLAIVHLLIIAASHTAGRRRRA